MRTAHLDRKGAKGAEVTPSFSNFFAREATEVCPDPFSVDSLALPPYYQTLKKAYLPRNVAYEEKGRLAGGLDKIAFF
ncbi:MAG: hypothetical protein ABSE19_01990 [Candidatus Acidiferrum sp.]